MLGSDLSFLKNECTGIQHWKVVRNSKNKKDGKTFNDCKTANYTVKRNKQCDHHNMH